MEVYTFPVPIAIQTFPWVKKWDAAMRRLFVPSEGVVDVMSNFEYDFEGSFLITFESSDQCTSKTFGNGQRT